MNRMPLNCRFESITEGATAPEIKDNLLTGLTDKRQTERGGKKKNSGALNIAVSDSSITQRLFIFACV